VAGASSRRLLGVPGGNHLHLEDSNALEDESFGLVLERSDAE
jgi:hypothetical protein